jgi:hypothetical protein
MIAGSLKFEIIVGLGSKSEILYFMNSYAIKHNLKLETVEQKGFLESKFFVKLSGLFESKERATIILSRFSQALKDAER